MILLKSCHGGTITCTVWVWAWWGAASGWRLSFFVLRDDLAPNAHVNVNYTYTVLSMRVGLLPSSTARGRASDLLSNHREQNPGHIEYDDLSHLSCIISRFQIRSIG